MTVGRMNRLELWTMLRDSEGFLTVEELGDDGYSRVYLVVPVTGGAEPSARKLAEFLAGVLSREPGPRNAV